MATTTTPINPLHHLKLRPSFPSATTTLSFPALQHSPRTFPKGCSVVGRKVRCYLSSSENPPKAVSKNVIQNNGVVPRKGGSGSGRIGLDPFRGKSGSVSFCGLNYQVLEERRLVSAPFKDDKGSILWVFGPLALISSLLVPQFFIGNVVEVVVRDVVLAEIVATISAELIFYAGLAVFLSVVDHVQRPYLEFSSKRWSLITGLKGYLSSAFFTMGFKVFAPLLAAYVVWPVVGLAAVAAIAPLLLGCAVQYAFEMKLAKRKSSSWPLVPIIFEVYRLYQLNKGAYFIERLMLSLKGAPSNPVLIEKGSALVSMLVVFQLLGIVCMWSLAAFLLRLFPSRPVAENY